MAYVFVGWCKFSYIYSMKQIDKEFIGVGEIKGITFKQLERQGLHCIYSRSDGYFEVITLIEQQSGSTNFNGKVVNYEAKEIYCRGESWGFKGNGKCVATLKQAKELFNERI